MAGSPLHFECVSIGSLPHPAGSRPSHSISQGRPFQELLQYFAMERFLYRLAKSPYSDRFILKGALLLTAWRAQAYCDDPARAIQWRAFER